MHRGLLILILFCCKVCCLHAQLFLPVGDDPFSVPIAFNRDSVVAKKIRFIYAGIQYKPDQQQITDKGLREYYSFDSTGNLSLYWRTRIRSKKQEEIIIPAVYRKGRRIKSERVEYINTYIYDTVFVHYYYDSSHRLSIRRLSDGDYYNTWYYTWNTDNTLNARIHVRETNLGRNHTDFRLGVQTIISDEKFTYERYSPLQLKQIALNDEGKSYRYTIFDYDSAGHLLSEQQSFIIGGIASSYTYQYDKKGRLASWTYKTNGGDSIKDILRFDRDSLGRLAYVRRFRNDLLYDEFSYLYDAATSQPYAFINRLHQQAGIDIVKLYYNELTEERKKKR